MKNVRNRPRRQGGPPRRRTQAALTTAVVIFAAGEPIQAAEPFPSLATAIERARALPESVIAARGEVAAARAMGPGAALSPLDNPYFEVFGDRATEGGARDVAVQANLWVPVEVSGQRGRRIAEVDRLSAWRLADSERIEAESVAEAVSRYGQAMTDSDRVRFLERIVATSEEEAALYRARVAAGDATVRDASLAAVDLSRNRMALEEARADRARGLAALAIAIGAIEVEAPAGREVPPQKPWTAFEHDPEGMLNDSPLLRALEREASYYGALAAREAVAGHAPLDLILTAGRSADGAPRLGAGLAWTFPVLRHHQAERARASAERARTLDRAAAFHRDLLARARGLFAERVHVQAALDELSAHGEPSAEAAVEAAKAIERAGKGELLHVVTARRDLISVRASGLALEARQWTLLGRLVALTGRTP